MHAILLAEDIYGIMESSRSTNIVKFLQNYDIYIGNSPNFEENTKCAGGPFLDPSDPATFVYSQYAFN